VGIDRDYDSLRQDLWIATIRLSRRRRDLFAQAGLSQQPGAAIGHRRFSKPIPCNSSSRWRRRIGPTAIGNRKRAETSATLAAFSEIHESRVTYLPRLRDGILLTSEGTENPEKTVIWRPWRPAWEQFANDGVPAEPLLCHVRDAARRFARRGYGTQGLNVTGTELMGAASRATRAGLYRPGAF